MSDKFKFNPFTGKLDIVPSAGTGSGDVTGPSSSTDNAIARYDGLTGKVIQNSGVTISDTNEIDGATTFNFDILYTKTGSEPIGTMYWNETDGTIDMRLKNGATLQTGQELHFYGKASGGISNGELCQFAGVQGDHILIKKAVASEIIAFPQYLVGVATQGIANGDFGYVTWFGKVNGVYTDTPNNNDSVDWVAGDILYFSNSTGQLTKTQPSAPNRNIVVAAVVREQTGASETGILLIRPTFGFKLADCDDVDGASPDATGDLLSWNNTSQTWERNAYNITDYQVTSAKGVANGYASLDSSAKVPITQLPNSIMEYKGSWNATTNSPTLADGTGDSGDLYRVSVTGTQNLGSGSQTFSVGDFVIYNGTIWQRSPAGGTAGFTYSQIDASGGTSDTYGALSGTINGSNKVFTTSLATYVSGSLQIYLNGQLQTQGTSEDWQETTPASGTFTFTTAPQIGDEIIVSYKYSTSVATNADTLDGYEGSAFALLNASNQFSKLQQSPNILLADMSSASNSNSIVSDYLEISSGYYLELVSSSILEIT